MAVITLIGGPFDMTRHAYDEDQFHLALQFWMPEQFRIPTQNDQMFSYPPSRIIEYKIYRLPQLHTPEYIYVGIWVEGTGYRDF